jgi:NAD(P)-dependent dehydrogenase (short-subunit alcohol dehydrogenase family)
MAQLDGARALVTGGSSGIGRLTAARLAGGGADVIIADVATDAGRAVADEIGGVFVALDVADPQRWEAALSEVLGDGELDIVHLNAGVATGEADITMLTDAQYRRTLGVNVDGVVFGTRAVLPRLRTGGAIVATASLGGLTPMASDPIYSMTKHAVVAFVRSLATQLDARGITINAVCPGFADTPLISDVERSAASHLGVGLLDPAVVADTVVRIITEGRTGEAWFCQVGREPAPYEFRGVPGPR